MTVDQEALNMDKFCIWCEGRITSSNSTQLYHVFPRAIAGETFTWKPGTVCDACNALFGLRLEPALTTFLAERLVLFNVKTGRGKQRHETVLTMNPKFKVYPGRITSDSKTWNTKKDFRTFNGLRSGRLGGQYFFEKNKSLAETTRLKVNAEVLKIAFECLYDTYRLELMDGKAQKILVTSDHVNLKKLKRVVLQTASGKSPRQQPIKILQFHLPVNMNTFSVRIKGREQFVLLIICGIVFYVHFGEQRPKMHDAETAVGMFNSLLEGYIQESARDGLDDQRIQNLRNWLVQTVGKKYFIHK
jgi:hypothetical protein